MPYNILLFSDLEKPILTCPTNFSVTKYPGENYATVVWETTASDNVAVSEAGVNCSESSGEYFRLDVVYSVNCTASDIFGNVGFCNFSIDLAGKEIF